MLKPPFKLATAPATAGGTGLARHAVDARCESIESAAPPLSLPSPSTRRRLADLDPQLHCSVIGTCMSTAELRKLMARFVLTRDLSDLEVHHESVRLSSEGGAVSKTIHKALDQRHEAVVRRFSKTQDVQALGLLWEEALQKGEIPGAYWALLTHRSITPELRQKVFGDVHMLSHLVGAANRADIRRLVALERENAELRERAERQQLRSQERAESRDRSIEQLRLRLADAESLLAATHAPAHAAQSDIDACREEVAAVMALVAVQTERRERAEQTAGVAENEARRLQVELDHLKRHVEILNRELAAAETQLREIDQGASAARRSLMQQLNGRRVLYVGGRPSSTPSIRALVQRHGGEFQHHDGGLEDRKGLLAAGVNWAQLVVFPVDCIDHDSPAT